MIPLEDDDLPTLLDLQLDMIYEKARRWKSELVKRNELRDSLKGWVPISSFYRAVNILIETGEFEPVWLPMSSIMAFRVHNLERKRGALAHGSDAPVSRSDPCS